MAKKANVMPIEINPATNKTNRYPPKLSGSTMLYATINTTIVSKILIFIVQT